jgi:hypothetical protein
VTVEGAEDIIYACGELVSPGLLQVEIVETGIA